MVDNQPAYFVEKMKYTYPGILRLVSDYSDLYWHTLGVRIFTLCLLDGTTVHL